ncbi:MAG TPA: hypothetical protein ENI11_02970 [Actinobacteria bacterium]|nr:hypothetical protein [Actinomycetota bacterium]
MKKILVISIVILAALTFVGCKKSADDGANQQPPAQGQNDQAPAPAPQNVGPPTVVEDGKKPVDHVTKYFDAYKDGRLEDAFKLQPAETKAKQPEKDFIALRKGMPIDDYKILPTQKTGNTEIIPVEYDIGQYGTWISTWTFEKKDGKWTALRYIANPKG